MSEQQVQLMVQMKAAGMRLREIASELGCSKVTVCRRLRQLRQAQGHKPRSHSSQIRGHYQRTSLADVLARYKEIPLDTRDLTATIFGDPVTGRSALDRRTKPC